ncbi:MAG: alkylphosphonate utilization protein [Hydrogenovibrio sp.]|uniref:alkylphosphonate utilization protein n=1 Tax=Hydrogenovibrio TaxID=28884 RepID=UPI000377C9F8|nr:MULTISPECIES: alkylphosphonate utilization protein [Hydrogenovibrio]MDR9497796.1 alkylphosphonate utilization protein [Hydrogenovibrio sp.]
MPEIQTPSLIEALKQRAQNRCELSGEPGEHAWFVTGDSDEPDLAHCILVSPQSLTQLELAENDPDAELDAHHWRCLNDSIWSPEPAVQVTAWRLLERMRDQGWPQPLLDMMYMEDTTREWAEKGSMAGLVNNASDSDAVTIKDANGTQLSEGDSVTLVKDLDVKGTGFTAKRGTLVKNIHLTDNPKHIEGKVNGTQIVLVAAFVKKA